MDDKAQNTEDQNQIKIKNKELKLQKAAEKKARIEAAAEAAKVGKEHRHMTSELLGKEFPDCFSFEDPSKVKPLKVGIVNEVIEIISVTHPEISKTTIRRVLNRYCRSDAYLRCVQVGVDRVDLHGNATSKVTEEDVAYAKTVMEQNAEYRAKQEQAKKAKLAMKANNANKRGAKRNFNPKFSRGSDNKQGGERKPRFNNNRDRNDRSERTGGFKPRQDRNAQVEIVTRRTPKSVVNRPFERMDATDVVPGKQVRVLFGQRTIKAEVKDVTSDVVTVVLSSGAVAKVPFERIGK